MKTARIVALLAAVLAASCAMLAAAELEPAPAAGIHIAAEDTGSRFVALGVGKSVVVDLPRDIKDVLVANPAIANAIVRSARRAYLIGAAIGQTNVFFFDADGRQIAGFDIAVKRDLNGMRAALRQLLPQADVRLEGVGEGVMLSGSVASAGEAQQAYDLAGRLVGDPAKVVNSLTVHGRDQVMIKVTVAEVQRSIIAHSLLSCLIIHFSICFRCSASVGSRRFATIISANTSATSSSSSLSFMCVP